jgi:RNA ligase
MKIYPSEIISIEEIQKLAMAGFDNWIQYGYVNVTERGDLLLFDYTTRAHITNRWNFFERVCRGLIINKKTGEIVARPFDKFFYWLADGRKVSGHIVTITEKIDGSLAIHYRHKGEHLITTKGSFFSPQARRATKFLNDHFDLSELADKWTLLFEIIYPENRIIVDYGKQEDLVLLAARNRHTGDYMPFFPDLYTLEQDYGFTLPKVYQFNSVDDIIAQTGGDYDNFEGWVVEFSDGQRVKFKTDRYVEIHRYIRQLDFANVLQAVRKDEIDYLTTMIPDEFLENVYLWIEQIRETVAQISKKTVQAFVQSPRTSGEAFQQWVAEHQPELAPYLMAMWEGKDIEPLIYRLAFADKLTEPE